MEPKKNDFTIINNEANKIWNNSVSALEQTTSDSISKAYKSMSSSQKSSAVKRKRAAGNTGPKPTNVKTIVRKK